MRPFLLLLLAALLSLPASAQTSPQKTKVVTKKGSSKAKTTIKSVTKGKPAAKPAPKPVEEVEAPVLVFKRTPCFGKCPVYTANVFADGRVEYEGQQHVGVVGRKEFALPITTVAEMLRLSQEVHFSELQDLYSKGTSDLPSTVVAVLLPSGAMKAVRVEEGAPDELMGFINYLRAQLDPLAGLVQTADR
ncbi:hypothetical protein GCM10023185_43960 [Hymenobacter saemangeumensis]|uniref:DUF6438 domain-containing protein n=1 Tax=Hymenobacter saemangeumensis TaxID=1084522 RepID=A0ABP8ISJ6_9BACT